MEAGPLRLLMRRSWTEGTKLSRSRSFSSETAPRAAAGPSSSSSSVPGVALALGAAGAAPFLALAPQVEPHVPLLPDFVRENAAALHVGYGVAIASFLGGIHWGLAASGAVWRSWSSSSGGGSASSLSPAAAAAAAAAAARPSKAATAARYLWSVVPCLLAWPATALVVGGKGKGGGGGRGKEGRVNEARAAGLAAATLAAAAAADAAFASKGLLPPYLMKLRVPLSFAAVGGLGLRALDAREKR